MIAVLDASASVEIIVQRSYADQLMSILQGADWIVCPELYISEVSNAFWKYHRFHGFSMSECSSYLDQAFHLADEFVPIDSLYHEAFSLACRLGHPVYDVFYLVLTRRRDGFLLTMDKKLRTLAADLSIQVFAD